MLLPKAITHIGYLYKFTNTSIAMLKDFLLLQVELMGFKQGHTGSWCLRAVVSPSLLLTHFLLNEDIDR